MLYELLHKKVPFIGRRIEDVRQSLLKCKLNFKPGLDESLKDLMSQMLDKNVYKRITLANILKHEALVSLHQKINAEFFPEKEPLVTPPSESKKKAKHNVKSISMTDNYINGVFKKNMKRHSNHRTVARHNLNLPKTVSSQNNVNNVLENSKSVKNIYEYKRSIGSKITTSNLLYNQAARPRLQRATKNESLSVELSLKVQQRPRKQMERSQQRNSVVSIKNYSSMDKTMTQSRMGSPAINEQPARARSRKKKLEVGAVKSRKKKTHQVLNKIKLNSTPKFLKRPNLDRLKNDKKASARNGSKRFGKKSKTANMGSHSFKPKIIKRKRKGVSKEKIIFGKRGFGGLRNENLMLQTGHAFKSKLVTSDKVIDLKSNLGENSMKLNWKSKLSKAASKKKHIQSMQNFYPKKLSMYETPQKFSSPKMEPIKLHPSRPQKEFAIESPNEIYLDKAASQETAHMQGRLFATNSNTRELSKPKLNLSNLECLSKPNNFSKTVKMKLKNESDPFVNFEEVSQMFLKKETRKTIKKSNLKRQKLKPNLPADAKVKVKAKAKADFTKKAPRERGKKKMDINARLREMNKIRKSNKFSIYEEYMKKMKNEINKVSLKTYYKIPQECRDFRKIRKV